MPIYEYRCSGCGFQKEYLQKVTDPVRTDCPECGQPSFQKLLTAAGFQLKGSGWYVTDFKSGAKPRDSQEKNAGAKTDAKTDAKTEAKSEAKSEAKADTASAGSGSGSAAAAADSAA